MQNNILEQQQSNQTCTQNSQQLLQKIYNLLHQTLHPDTQTIRNAQKNLYILSNTPQFINTLLSIPLIPGIQNNMSKLAITYSNTYIKNIQYSQKQAQLIKTMQCLVQFIQIVQLDINIRKQGCHILTKLLLGEKNKLLLLACQQQFKKLLQNAIMKISEGNWKQVNLEYMAMFVHAVISAIDRVENHVQFVEITFGNVVKLACFVSRIIQQQIKNIGNSNKQYIQRIAAQSKILCIYLDSIKKYLDILHSINPNTTHIINILDFSQLFQKTIRINLPNNKYTLPIFYNIINTTNSINKLLQQLLTIKYKSIILLTKSFPGLAADYMVSGKNNNKRYELLENGDKIIEMLVKAGYQVFRDRNWWQLNRIQIQILTQIYNFLRIGIQTNLYYQTYTKLKAQIIYGIVMKSLMFSNNQYISYYDDPGQFINSIYHILGDNQNNKQDNSKDNNINGSNNSNSNNSKMQQSLIQSKNNQQIQYNIHQQLQIQIQTDNYNSFKSECANLLLSFTSHIDGTLTQLVILCLTVLQSPIVQTTYKKDLMLLLLCILSKNIQNNNNLIVGIGQVLIIALRLRNIPKNKQQQTMQGQNQNNQNKKRNWNQLKISAQYGTQYILILLCFQQYLQMIDKLTQQLYQSLLVIIQQIMIDNNVQDTPKLISCSLLSKILATSKISFIVLKNLLYALLATLSLKQVHIKFISSLENIMQYSLKIFTKQTSSIYNNKNNNINNMLVQDKNNQQTIQIIIQIMNKIIQLIYIQVKKQANKDIRFNGLVYIGKLWNILRDIGEDIGHLGIVAQQMYKALSVLISLISDNNQQILQEHLYQLLCTMLKKYPNMNNIFLSLLTTISHKFHNSFTSRYSISLIYSFLSHIIFYLTPILSTPSYTNTIKCLLQMCVTSIQQQTVYQLPRSQGQMYQGLILMQSILISLSKNIQGQVWISLLDILYKKYKVANIVYDFYKAGLVTNMMVIIVFGYKYFQYGKVKQLLSQLLKCHYYFTYKKSSKIFTITVIQLFNLTQLPFFQQLFPQILQCSLIMLKSIQMGKQNIFQSQQLDTQQSHYIKLKQQTINYLNNIDQFHLFKNQLQKVKLQHNQLVDKAYHFLSENKRQYYREIFRLKKINDNIRVIYKIKHK